MRCEGLVDPLNIARCIEEPTEGLVARLMPAHVHNAFLEQRIRRDHDEVSELAVNAEPRGDPRPERHRPAFRYARILPDPARACECRSAVMHSRSLAPHV